MRYNENTMPSSRWSARSCTLSCPPGLATSRTKLRLGWLLRVSHNGAARMGSAALVPSFHRVFLLGHRGRRWRRSFQADFADQRSRRSFPCRTLCLRSSGGRRYADLPGQGAWSCLGGTYHPVRRVTPVVCSKALLQGPGFPVPSVGSLAVAFITAQVRIPSAVSMHLFGSFFSRHPSMHPVPSFRSFSTACYSSATSLSSSSLPAAASLLRFSSAAFLSPCRSSACFLSVSSSSTSPSHPASPAPHSPTGSLSSSPASVPSPCPKSSLSTPPADASLPSPSAPFLAPGSSSPPLLPFCAEGRTMPGQRLLPCTHKDIEILSSSSLRYPSPQEVEGGVIVRLVRSQDPVTSPVLRSVRNRQYGIRGDERWWLLGVGMLGTGVLLGLGVWQLRRMQWKQKLIDYRRRQLRRPPVWIKGEPFPWVAEEGGEMGEKKTPGSADSPSVCHAFSGRKDTGTDDVTQPENGDDNGNARNEDDRELSERDARVRQENSQGASLSATDSPLFRRMAAIPRSETALEGRALGANDFDLEQSRLHTLWAYRPVVVHGVLDTSTELVVGPRPGLEPGSPGYVFVSPLRLEDGSTLLVNKGHLPMEKAKLPPFEKGVERREGSWCIREMNLNAGAAALSATESLGSLRGRTPRGTDVFQKESRNEPPGWVTVRGVLDPGETPNTTWSPLLAGNRPKEGQFLFLVPKDLVEGLRPGSVKNRRSCAVMLVNAYDIVYDDDILEAQARSVSLRDAHAPAHATAAAVNPGGSSRVGSGLARPRGEVTEQSGEGEPLAPSMGSGGFSIPCPRLDAQVPSQPPAAAATVSKTRSGLDEPSSLAALFGLPGVRRRFSDYQQKRRDDYLLFWADEHTHFNYACQWFLMALCAASMTLHKFVQVSRWRW